MESRAKQLLKESIDEVEKYGSFTSMYLILKKVYSDFEKLTKEERIDYNIKVDDLILISLHEREMNKISLFVSSFLIYDYLSKNYIVQDGLFYFRWNKRIFIYSPRIESHIYYLIRLGYLQGIKNFKLTNRGYEEAESILLSLSCEDRKNIRNIIIDICLKTKLKELKEYVKKYLFNY